MKKSLAVAKQVAAAKETAEAVGALKDQLDRLESKIDAVLAALEGLQEAAEAESQPAKAKTTRKAGA